MILDPVTFVILNVEHVVLSLVQWAIEDRKTYNPDGLINVDDGKGDVLNEILDPSRAYFQLAYFAGGEPMITEEHYIIPQELIKKGKTNTTLRYNTNASTIRYKKYDT